ncbi:hypothetical protein [Cerasicoccus frondis]|uniref:hypothetical protein n=1 Tax=Cerasicoccus frondis TaxID=490090 RepID=UPI002852978D|nr:hypothetical protein [Cerasicoccus frondis]
MKLSITLITICMALASSALALAESNELVSFRFRMISWGAEPLSGIALPIDGEMKSLYAPIDQRSEALHYRGGRELSFSKHPGGKDDGALVVGKLTANAEWREVLFLAQYDRKSENLNLLALDDSKAAHPENSIRLLNLSGRPIAGLVNGEKVVLDEVKDQAVSLNGSQGFVPLQFVRKDSTETNWTRFLSTAIEVRQHARILIIFYPSLADDLSGEREVSFKLYYDLPEEEKFTWLN